MLHNELPGELHGGDPLDHDDLELLGHRDIDFHDWSDKINYQELVDQAADYRKNRRSNHNLPNPDPITQAAFDSLNPEQRLVFDEFVNHYQDWLNGNTSPQLLLQVDGRDGTGKSHLIRLLSHRMDEMAAMHGRPSCLIRAAPTGVAANNINGHTLYSLLRLISSF